MCQRFLHPNLLTPERVLLMYEGMFVLTFMVGDVLVACF
jgi:hypothetical protein